MQEQKKNSEYHDIKKELSQLADLQREVRLLEDVLENLRAEREHINATAKTDSVKGSMPGFPYVLHNITVQGIGDEQLGIKAGVNQDITDTKARLSAKRAECLRAFNSLTAFIVAIPDSRMRQIFTLKYVYGKKWPEIAAYIGNDVSEDGARKAHDRFLEKFQKCPQCPL